MVRSVGNVDLGVVSYVEKISSFELARNDLERPRDRPAGICLADGRINLAVLANRDRDI